jgi:hypothetical protein
MGHQEPPTFLTAAAGLAPKAAIAPQSVNARLAPGSHAEPMPNTYNGFGTPRRAGRRRHLIGVQHLGRLVR